MEEQIICAGFGGQGIMVLGKLLAYVGMNSGYNVTWMPSYGAEVRGGTAHSMVKIFNKEIASPRVISPNIAVVMNKPSYKKFESKVKKDGVLFVNSSLVDRKKDREEITYILVPATEIATKLGSSKVANMVMVGSYIEKEKNFNTEEVFKGLKEIIPSHRQSLIPINKKAVEEGMKIVQNLPHS